MKPLVESILFRPFSPRYRNNDSYQPAGRDLHATTMVGCEKLLVNGGRVGNQFENDASGETFTGEFSGSQWRWTLIVTAGSTPRFGHSIGIAFQSDAQCTHPSASNFTPTASLLTSTSTSLMFSRSKSPSASHIFATKSNNSSISPQIYAVFGRLAGEELSTTTVQYAAISCNAGSSAASFADTCEPCAAGTYSSNAGSTSSNATKRQRHQRQTTSRFGSKF